jgi:hypothetical protein
MNNIILIRHPVLEFPKSKISSLSEKYFSIPEDKLFYYPSLEDSAEHSNPIASANNRAKEVLNIINKKRGTDTDSTVNKGGRKKTVIPATPFTRSILRFMTMSPPSVKKADHPRYDPHTFYSTIFIILHIYFFYFTIFFYFFFNF